MLDAGENHERKREGRSGGHCLALPGWVAEGEVHVPWGTAHKAYTQGWPDGVVSKGSYDSLQGKDFGANVPQGKLPGRGS